MSVAQIKSDMAAARTALLAGDHATALRYAQAAQAMIAAMPRMSSGGRGGQELEYDQRGVAAFVAEVRRQQTAAGGVQATKITRHAPECPDDDSCTYQSGAYL